MIKFKSISNPRTGDGGFGPVFCEKCRVNSSAFLEIKFNTVKFVLCGGCLRDGSEMISAEILSEFKGE